MKKRSNEKGMIMVEAAIVLPLTLMVLVCFLAVGFYVYQRASVYTLASDTAVSLAKNYKYQLDDNDALDKSAIDVDVYASGKLKMYRAYISLDNRNKVQDYLNSNLEVTSFRKDDDKATINKCKIWRSGIGRQYVELDITVDSNLLFENVLQKLGIIENKPVFRAKAYAECLDISEYMSQIHFVDYIGNKFAGSGAGKQYDKTEQSIEKIANGIKSIINMIIGK